MSLSPVIRLPIADLTGAMVNRQWANDRCGDMEMKVIDCLEAYGLSKGVEKCDILIKDFNECTLRHKEQKRYMLMRDERERQYAAGERTKENRYAPSPRVDSW